MGGLRCRTRRLSRALRYEERFTIEKEKRTMELSNHRTALRNTIARQLCEEEQLGYKPKELAGRKLVIQFLPDKEAQQVEDEIFSLLMPLDLLELSWTTKVLRRTLMHRSARSLWIQALKNVEGLPECPEDLTEPQWASLVSHPCCHVSTSRGSWN
ncbi:hypothetical protein NEOLEDRAFT_775201 [Neolentinus lepideus HHB14362 ss-1]|uniref:F-box domain-containing protein n=1 Tax=Neolentinus lepideus HHB14362 ss-1 TaxID=1314782 RepID=A0A165UV65_9AGAM|nr:hypothetical protein NEOLEDRAFT_775201 [Neolentinus lepideus HHB14362 ss-1]